MREPGRRTPAPAADPALKAPLGLTGAPVYRFKENTPTTKIVALGQRMFSDVTLSGRGQIACATCHSPTHAFGGTAPVSIEANGNALRRLAPRLINRAFGLHQFWDSRGPSLEDEVFTPINSPTELGTTTDALVAKLKASPDYDRAFIDAFGQDPGDASVAFALSSYVRTIMSGDSRVDQYAAGQSTALTDSEQRGRLLFFGRGRCANCHNGPNYTDEQPHVDGLAPNGDPGLMGVTGRGVDNGRMKTPTLRGLSSTGPYAHDGSVATLADVVARYNQGGLAAANSEVGVLGLTAEEQGDLVAFLLALSPGVTAGVGTVGGP